MADKTAETISGKTDDAATSLEYEYATTTTLHGIGRVAESRRARGKISWLLVLLIATGVTVYVTVDRIQAYLRYEVSTNVNVKFHDDLDFPAVTICNYNRFMDSKISEDDKKYVNHLLQVSDDLSENFDYFESAFDSSSFEKLIDDDFNYTFFALATGYSLNESMYDCIWKGALHCHALNFSSYYSPSYGKCYTFNTLGQRHKQSQQGIGNGLQLVLDIKQPEYTETYSSGNTAAGLKFAIHRPDELPLLDTMGLSAAPGYHTYVSMRLVRHVNLPKPWGVCGTRENEDGEKYSRNTCLRNCRRDVIIDRCNCRPLGYERVHAYEGSVPLCNLGQFECVQSALISHRTLSTGYCNCPIACEYQTYETTLSTAKFPSLSVSKEAFKIYQESQGDDTSTAVIYDEDYAERNLVFLDVYFNELSEIAYEQVQALPFTALLGDLGGQLGLFLGASVITGVELLEYVVRRMRMQILKMKTRNKVQSIKA